MTRWSSIASHLALGVLGLPLATACSPSPPLDGALGSTGPGTSPSGSSGLDAASDPDIGILHGGPSVSVNKPDAASSVPSAAADAMLPSIPSGAGDASARHDGAIDGAAGRAPDAGMPAAIAPRDAGDANDVGDAWASPSDAAPSDAAPSSSKPEAEAPLGCAATRLCWHAAPARTDDCLARTVPGQRSLADDLAACERALCTAACTVAGTISTSCNDCVLRLCGPRLEACARASGCGDGDVAQGNEQCDDGNLDTLDACTNACTIAHCGDSIVARSSEECDDGNADERDDCVSTCHRARCGDGWVRLGLEGCDDGNDVDGDGCSASCVPEACGNGVLDPGEECDDGADNGDDRPCLLACARNRCGDGRLCNDAAHGCGSRHGSALESCDDGNLVDADACPNTCQPAKCGDGIVQAGVEACDDGNADPFDACGAGCQPAAGHLLISEVVPRPAGAEMIEIFNPTESEIDLSDYAVADTADYYLVALATYAGSGSDFVARFPVGASIAPGAYRTVAVGNASGGTASFFATYGKLPDFELLPTAHDALGDDTVPDMRSAEDARSSIGASASLTDGGEPVVLFRLVGSGLVADVDYVYYGTASSSNPAVCKTGVVASTSTYRDDTAPLAQSAVHVASTTSTLQRCDYGEPGEARSMGNGLTGHDETSEATDRAFVTTTSTADRTPGGPPPPALCGVVAASAIDAGRASSPATAPLSSPAKMAPTL